MAYCEDAPCCGCCNPREMMTATEPFDDWEEDSRCDEEPEDDGQPSDLQENQDFAHDDEQHYEYDSDDGSFY